jgi:hypothetical protein
MEFIMNLKGLKPAKVLDQNGNYDPNVRHAFTEPEKEIGDGREWPCDFRAPFRDYRSVKIVGDESGREFILKVRKSGVAAAISDVKLSELARRIDPNLASINLFGRPNDTNDIAILSQNICERGEGIANTDDVFPLVYGNEISKYGTFERSGIAIFQNLHLQKTFAKVSNRTSGITKSPDFVDRFVEQYLLSNALAIGDMYWGNNTPIAQKGKCIRACKQWDFEVGRYFVTPARVDDPEYFRRGIFTDAYPYLDDEPIALANIEFLKSNAPLATEKFLDNMTATIKHIPEILDCTKLHDVLKSNSAYQSLWGQKRLERLTDDIVLKYGARFQNIADQFTK